MKSAFGPPGGIFMRGLPSENDQGSVHAQMTLGLRSLYNAIKTEEQQELWYMRYKIKERIDIGRFCEVFRAEDTYKKQDVAIKALLPQFLDIGQGEAIRLANLVAHTTKAADTFHIISYINSFYYLGRFCIVTELMEESLDAFLKSHEKTDKFSDEYLDIVRSVTSQTLLALYYLGLNDLIHGDIKPGSKLVMKLADFGNSATMVEIPAYYSDYQIQSLYFRAPEFSKEIDMWSFGCVFCQMFTRQPIFSSESIHNSFVRIVSILGPVPREMLKNPNMFRKHFTEHNQLEDVDEFLKTDSLEKGISEKCTFRGQCLKFMKQNIKSPTRGNEPPCYKQTRSILQGHLGHPGLLDSHSDLYYFLMEILCYDPTYRLTPCVALKSDFLGQYRQILPAYISVATNGKPDTPISVSDNPLVQAAEDLYRKNVRIQRELFRGTRGNYQTYPPSPLPDFPPLLLAPNRRKPIESETVLTPPVALIIRLGDRSSHNNRPTPLQGSPRGLLEDSGLDITIMWEGGNISCKIPQNLPAVILRLLSQAHEVGTGTEGALVDLITMAKDMPIAYLSWSSSTPTSEAPTASQAFTRTLTTHSAAGHEFHADEDPKASVIHVIRPTTTACCTLPSCSQHLKRKEPDIETTEDYGRIARRMTVGILERQSREHPNTSPEGSQNTRHLFAEGEEDSIEDKSEALEEQEGEERNKVAKETVNEEFVEVKPSSDSTKKRKREEEEKEEDDRRKKRKGKDQESQESSLAETEARTEEESERETTNTRRRGRGRGGRGRGGKGQGQGQGKGTAGKGGRAKKIETMDDEFLNTDFDTWMKSRRKANNNSEKYSCSDSESSFDDSGQKLKNFGGIARGKRGGRGRPTNRM